MRHDLYARMRELSSKFEGVETVDVGTLPRRVRRENPDITSPLTNKRARQILSHFHRYLELRVPRRPRSFAKRVRKWAISRGGSQQTQLAISLVLHRIPGIGSPRDFIRFSRCQFRRILNRSGFEEMFAHGRGGAMAASELSSTFDLRHRFTKSHERY